MGVAARVANSGSYGFNNGPSGLRVATHGSAEYAERKLNEEIILNKPSANSASLW